MSVLRFFMLLSLVVWVGGIIFFSFVVAPTLFSILPTRHLSGLVVSRALTLLHWIGVASGGVFLILSVFHAYYSTGSAQAAALRNLLVFAMVVVTLLSQIVVSGKMAALKATMARSCGRPAQNCVQQPPSVVHRAGGRGIAARLGGGVCGGAAVEHAGLECAAWKGRRRVSVKTSSRR